MVTAIKSNSGVILENVAFEGFDVAVSSNWVDAKNVHFDRVGLPFDIKGPEPSRITGTRITRDPKLGTASPDHSKSGVGWRRPHGAPLPALCPSCKLLFPSKNYNIGSSAFYGFDNEETCPRCGDEHASVKNGLFDLTKQIAELISSEEIEFKSLQELSDIVTSLTKGEITKAKAKKKSRIISSEISNLIEKLTSQKMLTILQTALAAACLYYAANPTTDPSTNIQNITNYTIEIIIKNPGDGLSLDVPKPKRKPKTR